MNRFLSILILAGLSGGLQAQDMPVVFNKSFTPGSSQLNQVYPYSSGEVLIAGGGNGSGYLAKLSETGTVIFERKMSKDGMASYNDVIVTQDSSILAVGGGAQALGAGRITLFEKNGKPSFDKAFGKNTGGYFKCVKEDNEGDFIAAGMNGEGAGQAHITKLNKAGKILFDKSFDDFTHITSLIIDDDNDIIAIGGDAGSGKGAAVIIKLSAAGEELYHFKAEAAGSFFTNSELLNDGTLLAVGGGVYGSGNPARAVRIRPDGQVIFNKTYSAADGFFSDMQLDPMGSIFLATHEFDRGRILRLRPDGTVQYTVNATYPLNSLKVSKDGYVVAVGGSENKGVVIKVNTAGKIVFEKQTDIPLHKSLVSEDGEIYASSVKGFQIVKYDPFGNPLFSKAYTSDQKDGQYISMINLPSGEILAIGGGKANGSRATKISHGVMVNDITITEPLNGVSTASIKVSLTGFLRQDGQRRPVTVSYKSLNGSADSNDFVPVEGTLSFLPSDYANGGSIESSIEIPVKSDLLLERPEYFTIRLSNASNTYIAKADGKVSIEDLPAVIRFTGGEDAMEKSDLQYTVGLFKQDGAVQVNQTGSPVKIKYSFGNGSATPGMDYNTSVKTPLLINNGNSSGTLLVKTKDDNYYEVIETVELVLNSIDAAGDTKVDFPGGSQTIASVQRIIDQHANIQIVKLSDRNESSMAPAGMFKVMLVKAADGSLQSNCAGGDIKVKFAVDSTSTAQANKHFVVMNNSSINIGGNCDNFEANIQVVVIPDEENKTDKSIALRLTEVTGPKTAGRLTVSEEKNIAKATVFSK